MDFFRFPGPSQAVRKQGQRRTSLESGDIESGKTLLSQVISGGGLQSATGGRKAGGADDRSAGLGLREEETRLPAPSRVMATKELAPTATPGRGIVDETRHAS